MCVAAIGVIATLAGSVVSAFQGLQQARAFEQQARTQEAIAERNAKMEEYKGRYEARQIERRLRYIQGEAAANAGANGIGLDGSFLDIISDNEIQGEIDIVNAKTNAENAANSTRYEGYAAAQRSRAQAQSARLGAVGSLIGGASSFLRAVG